MKNRPGICFVLSTRNYVLKKAPSRNRWGRLLSRPVLKQMASCCTMTCSCHLSAAGPRHKSVDWAQGLCGLSPAQLWKRQILFMETALEDCCISQPPALTESDGKDLSSLRTMLGANQVWALSKHYPGTGCAGMLETSLNMHGLLVLIYLVLPLCIPPAPWTFTECVKDVWASSPIGLRRASFCMSVSMDL